MARPSPLDHLAQVALFSACSKKELQHVAKASDELTVPAGKVLCEEGAVGREAFVIVAGTAEVRRNGKKIATVGAGTCVGELALLDHGPRTATVTATSELQVLVLGAREFASLLDDVPAIAHKVLKAMATRIRNLDAKTYG